MRVQPVYISTGLVWETQEHQAAARFAASLENTRGIVTLTMDMRDVYPASHWALRGEAPAFDTPDTDVYLEGRNVVLLSKAATYMASIGSSRVWLGTLSDNPFPDGNRTFFDAMQRALSIGLGRDIVVETPFAAMHKADVIRLGASLGVKFERTLSCMQPEDGLHCGRCSKCRERRDAFSEAGIEDPADYANPPVR